MKKALTRTSKKEDIRAERALMLAFYKATKLGALQHWPEYSTWKRKRRTRLARSKAK